MHAPTRQIRLNQVIQTISSNSGTLLISGLRTADPENPSSSEGDTFHLSGMAVLSNWELKGWMDGEAAWGYMWITKQIEHHGLSVPYRDGMISLSACPTAPT